MHLTTDSESNLVIRVGIVARGSRCVSIMQILGGIKPTHLRLNLVGIAAVTKSIACYKYAGEMNLEVFDDYLDLVTMENLDLILEFTGDQGILENLIRHKRKKTGVLDRPAALLLVDIAKLFEKADRREAEISMVTSFASALLEASPDGVMVIDRDFRIINCNDSALITGGKDKKEILGRRCHGRLNSSETPCTCGDRICPTLKTLETGRTARAVHEILDENGESQITQVTTYPITNHLGQIVRFVVTVRDMTQDLSERIEQRTKAIKDDLALFVREDRLASLGRLVASVCHEINNPISSIVTFNKLILSYIREDRMPDKGIAEFERYLELSVNEALRCGSIVNNLLTFARQRTVEAKAFDMKAVVKTVIMLVQHQLELGNVNYALDLPHKDFTAWGDYAQIQQCIMNLIFNAIESMPDGGDLIISGSNSEDGCTVKLSVTDSGHGIKPEDLPRIFEPFYSTKQEGKRVGLGLSMAYGIIREHNGHISVVSEPGKGTTFSINLPVNSHTSDELRE
ncbi:MAG: PAS domain-containing protein [Desulfobacteraceae bacterium]|nr:PAS domain-containing protein [Desulfobacteraceae bacterium]